MSEPHDFASSSIELGAIRLRRSNVEAQHRPPRLWTGPASRVGSGMEAIAGVWGSAPSVTLESRQMPCRTSIVSMPWDSQRQRCAAFVTFMVRGDGDFPLRMRRIDFGRVQSCLEQPVASSTSRMDASPTSWPKHTWLRRSDGERAVAMRLLLSPTRACPAPNEISDVGHAASVSFKRRLRLGRRSAVPAGSCCPR